MIFTKGRYTKNIRHRITQTRKIIGALNGVWWSKNITRNRKIIIYNSMVKSVLIYGAEIWCCLKYEKFCFAWNVAFIFRLQVRYTLICVPKSTRYPKIEAHNLKILLTENFVYTSARHIDRYQCARPSTQTTGNTEDTETPTEGVHLERGTHLPIQNYSDTPSIGKGTYTICTGTAPPLCAPDQLD
jgi:hypothetical protein